MSRSVYIIKDSHSRYKIGISVNPRKRLKQLQTGAGCQLELVDSHVCDNVHKVEKGLHFRYSFFHDFGECYNLPQSYLSEFHDICNTIDNNINILKNSSNDYV